MSQIWSLRIQLWFMLIIDSLPRLNLSLSQKLVKICLFTSWFAYIYVEAAESFCLCFFMFWWIWTILILVLLFSYIPFFRGGLVEDLRILYYMNILIINSFPWKPKFIMWIYYPFIFFVQNCVFSYSTQILIWFKILYVLVYAS